ncbi:Polyisoprenoid-binding protein OS=Streptomyces fumanus OX=67302 GN=GCM10018772_53570 PE=4 SV=1 [Streptomyces fumanus]
MAEGDAGGRGDSIDTGSADRDGHLRARTSRHGQVADDDVPLQRARRPSAATVPYGDLTILGTTRPLTIDLEFNGAAKDPFGYERVGFEGKAEILRSEWGLTCNAALRPAVCWSPTRSS